MSKKICIFDFDGTLVDSMEGFATIAGHILERRYQTPFEEGRRRYLETSGVPFFEQLEILFPGDPRNAATAEEFERTKLENYFEQPLFEGASELFRHLQNKGILSAISSNNFQHLVTEFVDRKKIPCDFALGYQKNFAKGKDHFDYLRQTLAIHEEDMLFVGDSLKDAEKAAGSNIEFVGKVGTFNAQEFRQHHPNANVIEKLLDLVDFF